MATKPTKRDTLNFKVRTATAGCDYKGELDEGIKYAFFHISTPERRLAVLADLQKAHEKLLECEALKGPTP